MKTFSNVSQFKKLLAVGVNLKATYHKEFAGLGENNIPLFKNKDLGIRPVSKVQSNSFALETINSKGEKVNSWCNYPKVSECKIIDNNTLVIYEQDGKPVLTYSFPD